MKNILFIMADQLRYDYLGYTGHPTIKTPNINALAARGVSFSQAYVQSPVCGPSRMCFYTGRYISTHGSTWNYVPLPVSEMTMGDHLRSLGMDVLLVGKSHVTPDLSGLKRLNIDPKSEKGQLLAEGGFRIFERDDGIHADAAVKPDYAYNKYLKEQGFGGPNPWHYQANSTGKDEPKSGWYLKNVGEAARVPAEHSETAYITNRAIDCIKEQSGPWCIHLSYIKPHWPYVAPAPYNSMYSPKDLLPVLRDPLELNDPHPVLAAYYEREECQTFRDENVRNTVVPIYMGMIHQIDDEIGRLMKFLESRGEIENTMIVFTSDHGDYLGDHWLGDKELFHRQSSQIPLIIVDPDLASNSTRGSVLINPVEAIDLLPTFIDYLGGEVPEHILEGRSLKPLLNGKNIEWRDMVFSELDYSFRQQRRELEVPPHAARAYNIRNSYWNYTYFEGFSAQLFDLENDPNEFIDLGKDPSYAHICAEFEMKLFAWLRARRRRITISDEAIEAKTESWRKNGVFAGAWSPEDQL
jgi:arylsulfatase A-like enzyme